MGRHHPYTHVLTNDPTMGYGIFIENMLEGAFSAPVFIKYLCFFPNQRLAAIFQCNAIDHQLAVGNTEGSTFKLGLPALGGKQLVAFHVVDFLRV